jgi:hypothetical protein
VSRRTWAYVGIALGLLALGRVVVSMSSGSAPPAPPEAPVSRPSDDEAGSANPVVTRVPLERPPKSVAELGVLTDRPESELDAIISREALIASLTPRYCGDDAACAAVSATLRDAKSTTVQVVASGDWHLERANVDASARGFSATERAKIKARQRIVTVRVSTRRSPQQLALRAAVAATAAIAERIDGLVWDQLLDRFERARDFAAHAVTEPLGASTLRRDRIEVLYEPKGEGIVRVLTGGLSRWGAPDVDAIAVPVSARDRLAELVLGVAEVIANGGAQGPFSLTLDDLARTRGKGYPADAGLPESSPVPVAVVSVHPETGDPNDFIARIEPPGGDGPLAYVELAERFFGPLLMGSPGGDVLATRHAQAQAALSSSLAQWSAGRASGATLLVQLPFAIPGDGGIESMWIDVTRFDDATVTGKVEDDSLGATYVHRGDEVTRPRAEVDDLQLRGASGPR